MIFPFLTRRHSQTPANPFSTCPLSSPLCRIHYHHPSQLLQAAASRRLLWLIYPTLTPLPSHSIKRCTSLLPSRRTTPQSLTRKRSTGTNLICPRRTNTSGTASHSEAFVNGAARMAVSLHVSVPPTCVLTNPLALYEADRAAHEEAVRNGGVCLVMFPTCDRLTFFFFYLRSLSCTGTGFPTRIRALT